MTNEAFRETLIEQMERQSLSAEDVARLAAVSVSAVRRWREGVMAPRPILKRYVTKILEEKGG